MNKRQRKKKQKRQHVHEHKHVRQEHTDVPVKPVQPVARKTAADQPIPLWTKTGELFQPVRLYYTIRNSRKIRKRLESFACIRRKSDDNRWGWMYTAEASDISFEKKIVRVGNPIELGTLGLWGEHGMFLDVHSIERALAAMQFFDRHIPHRLLHISHISVVNSLFDSQRAHSFQFPFCAESDALAHDPILVLFTTLDRLNKRRRSSQEKQDVVTSYLQTATTSTFPRIEHLGLRFSRKHLRQIRFLLESRQYVAIQRWKGAENLTPVDYVYALIQAESEAAIGK